jgi:hypothetical protein
MNRRQILVAHYAGLLKRFSAWLGVITLLASVGLPNTALATGELTSRSATLSTSSPAASAATTTYTFTFVPVTNATIKAISFQMCTSPIEAVSCTAPTGGSMSAATFSTTGQAAPFNANWALGAGGNCGAPSATAACITWATGDTLNNPTSRSVKIGGIQNPTTANFEYYMRVTTWTDANGTTPANGNDFGAMAVSTGTTVNVSALVQESLVFSVGQTGACGSISGSQVYLGSPSNGTSSSVLSSSAASAGTSVMCVNTNAGSGYTIAYTPTTAGHGAGGHFTNFTGTSHDFNDNATGATITSGTSGNVDFFGASLKAATPATGDIAGGANVSGGTAPSSYGTGYGTADTFAWSNTGATMVTENTGATSNTLYTVLYEAQSGSTTPFGQYEVNVDYTATSTF